jgi:hypothetical protein
MAELQSNGASSGMGDAAARSVASDMGAGDAVSAETENTRSARVEARIKAARGSQGTGKMLEIRLPLKAESTANIREHWAARARRTKAQRAAVARRLHAWSGGPLLVVRLTRISPRMLDSGDNLSMSLKGFRDSVASRLKIDDASPLVEWQYHQAKGEAEVVVQIWRWNAEGDAPPLPVGQAKECVAASSMKGGRSRVVQKRLAAGASVHAAYTPPPDRHPDDAAFTAEVMRRVGLKAASLPPHASRTNPMATKAMEPSNAAEHRALSAAQQAEETFAPRRCKNCDDGLCAECSGAVFHGRRP